MITIQISKSHCKIITETIQEALPAAQAAGMNTEPVKACLIDDKLDTVDSVKICIQEDSYQAILAVLRHHPLPEVGNFFIHHLQKLVEDALLGYAN